MITFIVVGVVALGLTAYFLLEQFDQFRKMAALALALDRARTALGKIDRVSCGCITDLAAPAAADADQVLKATELDEAVREWKLSGGSR